MKFILKEFWKAFGIGLIIYLVLGVIRYFNVGSFFDSQPVFLSLLYNQLYSIVLYIVNASSVRYFVKRYKSDFFKFKYLVISMMVCVLVTLISIFLINFFIAIVVQGENIKAFIAGESPRYYYASFIISMVITLMFYSVFYYRHKQEKKVKEQKIIAGTASAKYDALKNQLDPHFLFNSLNVLTSLIEENPLAAGKFTTALSKVYRYVLEQKSKDLVTVDEELKFAGLYMSLMKMRFEDSIVFTMPDTVKDPSAKVVPLSLQLLLENAVKHNQVAPSKKLHISITEVDGNLIISNNMQPKQVLRESTGVGLRNIKQRYELLTKSPVIVNDTKNQFSISIPMLTKETTIMRTQDVYISEKKYQLAKEQVEKIKGFYIHASIYLIFVPIFIWLNYMSNTGFPWAIFPIGGWGFGVISHAAETFNYNPFFGKDWEERKIKQYMDDDN